jgi:hypothetical protein
MDLGTCLTSNWTIFLFALEKSKSESSAKLKNIGNDRSRQIPVLYLIGLSGRQMKVYFKKFWFHLISYLAEIINTPKV